MSVLDVVVKFVADASSVTSEVAKVEGASSRLTAGMKGVGAAIGTAFAVHEVNDWVNAAEDAEQVTHKLEQVLRNAGDSTGEWAKHAEDLATSLMNKTAIDDEQIKSGEAILATSHAISNEAARQAGILDTATVAAANLSRAGFGTMESASKALAKALEDPVKGMNSLRRANVVLTQAQQDQIKSMVAAGDTLGAQKILLDAVEQKVGGVAEKTATSGEKMKVAWGETQEALGTALLPVLQAITPWLQKLATFVQKNATWLVPLAAAILAVVAAIKLWAIAQAIINVLLTANPIGLIVLGIAALIAIIVLIVTHFDIFKQAAIDAFNFVLDIVQTVWNWISENWPLLLAILTGPIGMAVYLIVENWNTIKNALAAAIDFMVGLWNSFINFVASIPGRVWAAIQAVGGFILNAFQWGLDRVIGLIESVVNWFVNLPGRVASALGGLAGQLFDIGRHAMSEFLHGLESLMGSIASKVASFVGNMLSKLNPFGSPHTVAYYQGQNVMRDYLAGAASMQRRTAAGFAGLSTAVAYGGAPTGTAAGARGGATYNINVSVGAGVVPAEVGAAVVDQIRAYERVAGRGWRA